MKVEIFRGTTKIAGPIVFNQENIRNIVASHGGNGSVVPVNFSSAMTIGTIVIKRVVEDRPPITIIQRHVMDNREETATEVIYHYTVADASVPAVQSKMIRQLSTMHVEYENTPVLHRDILVKVDLEARIAMMGVMDAFTAGTITSESWRGKVPSANEIDEISGTANLANGRIAIASTVEMQALYTAAQTYLRKGFDARSTVEDSVNGATTLAALEALNIRTMWSDIVNA